MWSCDRYREVIEADIRGLQPGDMRVMAGRWREDDPIRRDAAFGKGGEKVAAWEFAVDHHPENGAAGHGAGRCPAIDYGQRTGTATSPGQGIKQASRAIPARRPRSSMGFESRGRHLKCGGDTLEPDGIDILAGLDTGNLNVGQAAGQGKILDSVARSFAKTLDDLPDFNVRHGGNAETVRGIDWNGHEVTPSVVRGERARRVKVACSHGNTRTDGMAAECGAI